MKEIIEKISSYNIFNYLFPGIIFTQVLNTLTPYNLIGDDIVTELFKYYFIGLVISRFGSIVIEPFLRKTKLLKFADYSDFISSSKKDPKIDLLSEVNNMYRTILSAIVLLFLSKLWNIIEIYYLIDTKISLLLVVAMVGFLFLFSYVKQTNYIKKRIDNAKSK
ncbi:hypothetical protein APF79_01365 [bacterium BRH_c32]|nr:MAG: hypothetical protein APF79_01365 [bacterium BRH_c32]